MTSEWSRISKAELEVIEPYLANAPVKIATMARALGLEVKSAILPPGISGQLQRCDVSLAGFRIRVSKTEVSTRQRFTIAHEVAHFLLHRDLIGDGIEDTILYRSSLSSPLEAEANRLAAHLLMPATLIVSFMEELKLGRNEAAAKVLAEKFDVSEAAMGIRIGLG